MKFLVLLFIVVLSSSSFADNPCVPGEIDDITLDSTKVVSWVSNPNDCTVTKFIIDIFDKETNIHNVYDVDGTKLNVNLELCKEYTFDVRAITSENVSGPTHDVNLTTKLSKDDNVGVDITSKVSSASGVTFEWKLSDPSVTRCVTSYKVVHWNEDDSPVTEDVTEQSYTFKPTVSCMTYYLVVNADVNEPGITPPSTNGSIRAIASDPPDKPSLTKDTFTPTTSDFLFTVQTYVEYRCGFLLYLEIVGPDIDEKYNATIVDNASRERVVSIHVENLQPNTVYDAYAWTENDVGSSAKLNFQFTTPSK
ncbi:uncharacterized protein [Euwallacea similis]|uniref:uncharacterized protein n=1 Tax=Euwallacea similis TaxID=1736056 RepID=UPI00344CA270